MKRSISLLSAFAFVLAFSGSVYGQNVEASAQIVTSIDYTVNQGLYFGQLSNNFSNDVTLDPRGTNTANLGAGADDANDYGKVTISGDPNVDFNLTITDPGNLGNGSDQITFSGSHYGENTNEDPTDGTTSLASGTEHTLSTNGDSEYYIYLGGTLTAPGSSLSSGEYTGDIQIDVSYL